MRYGNYESFAEVASVWKIKPITKTKENEESLKKKFTNRHICQICKQPFNYIIGTNVMTCKNPSCKGHKETRTDKEGNQFVIYHSSFHTLDDVGIKIANSIYNEES